MEILASLLLIGLVALLASTLRLSARLGSLERRVGAMAPSALVANAPSVSLDKAVTEPRLLDPEPVELARPAPPGSEDSAPGFAHFMETLVGGRLLVWVGGVALVVAAVLLIRFSIEIGLVTPRLRMIAAAAFGVALVVGGELGRASRRLREDPRTAQALVGAGLAILYATVYGSYILYGFLSLGAASALMVAVTAAALALSLRHGAPTAAMGMIGGFLMPLLVGDPDAGALLLLAYLALLDAAVFAIALQRGWGWMAAAAILASFAWTASLLFGPAFDAVAAGWFVLGLAALAGLARPSGAAPAAGVAMGIAALQLAILVARNDLGGLPWLQGGCLALASLALARWRSLPGWAPLLILLIGLMLLPITALWPDARWLREAAAGMTMLFGVGGLLLALERRSTLWTALACAGCAGPAMVMRLVAPDTLPTAGWGLVLALLALGPAALVWAHRSPGEAGVATGLRALLPALTAAALLAFALGDLASADTLSIAWLLLALGFITAGIRLPERTLRVAGLVLLTLTVLKVFLIDAAALEGVLRILSFLGLGAALIVLGRYYGTLMRADRVTV